MTINSALVLIIAAPLLFACSEDDSTNVDVTMQSVAGTYYASSARSGSKFELVQSGSTTNGLTQGITVQITLNANGTTSGTMHLPALEGEPASDEDLTGTWTLDGNVVKLSHASDTLLRDITFTADGNQLTGALTTSSSVTTVILVK